MGNRAHRRKLNRYQPVILSGVRSENESRNGASYKVLSLIGTGSFQIAVSVPLIFEYESVAKRMSTGIGLALRDIDEIIDFVCHIAIHQKIFYL